MELVTEVLSALGPDQRAALERFLHRRDLTPRQRERGEMVKAAGLGQSLATIAVWSGREQETVQHWLRRYLTRGLAGLADAPRPGRPVRADAAYLEALEGAMATAPRELGLLFDVWTSPRLSAYLAEQTGVRIAPGWLRVLLGQRDFVVGRPKHTLRHLRNATEVAACEAELAAAGEKGQRGARALRAASSG
jgi:transposase